MKHERSVTACNFWFSCKCSGSGVLNDNLSLRLGSTVSVALFGASTAEGLEVSGEIATVDFWFEERNGVDGLRVVSYNLSIEFPDNFLVLSCLGRSSSFWLIIIRSIAWVAASFLFGSSFNFLALLELCSFS